MSPSILKNDSNVLSRLSKNAKIALRNASLVSEYLKVKQISIEHLFVGILLNEECLATRAIEEMGLDRGELLRNSFGGKVVEITVNPNEKRQFVLSQEVKFVLRKAYDISRKMAHVYVGTEHIMIAILQFESDYIKSLGHIGLNTRTFRKILSNFAVYPLGLLVRPDISLFSGKRESIIDALGIDLVEAAKEGRLDPVIGRENELKQLVNILSRRKKNNPIIIGEAGVGKSVLVEGLAQRIASGNVPQSLQNFKIILLDVSSIMAGSKMRGDVEEKVMSIVEEVVSSNNTILFIDEIHNIVSPSMMSGSSDISSILKPALLRDGFRCIGATTTEDYSSYFEDDTALARRFQPIFLEEASQKDTIQILENIKPILEKHHNVKIDNDVLKLAVSLSDRYVNDRYLPDKAIDLLDEASASKRLEIEEGYSDISVLQKELENIQNKKESEIVRGDMARAEDLQEKENELEKKIKRKEKLCLQKKNKKGNEISQEDIRKVISKWTGIPINT
ncbi:MAG: AAA family ATPase, partial [Candidatus Dojkabacteria bacterium]|nr:AAA family ATPase [Candidatus Dojkabacteria bacterium]